MAQINITLYLNKQHRITSAADVKIVAGEHDGTEITVEFPGELASYSKRVDFLNIKGEKWTEALYTPEDERNEYDADFDESNFTIGLPQEVTMAGELLLQFIAYVPKQPTIITFEMVRLTVEDGIGYCKKRAPRNPDLIIRAYEYSNRAMDIARDALTRTVDSERAALAAEAAALDAQAMAQEADSSAREARAQAVNSARSAVAALERAEAAEQYAAEAVSRAFDPPRDQGADHFLAGDGTYKEIIIPECPEIKDIKNEQIADSDVANIAWNKFARGTGGRLVVTGTGATGHQTVLADSSAANQVLLKAATGNGTLPTWGKINNTHIDNLPVQTTAPTAATDGLRIAFLTTEPATKHAGWLYLIAE